ncbi:adenine nucleotide translocase lysine N-methyltransferase [Lampris incognitus]|uniref:adenine nucleotide translocase lysine N-methyltransferase n=1 Tax=Lampris incognitus TaxID=2546036 RepID=UPI0024B6306C|nr:adenine nucleotide translocase lysine N-methyltransferase [Lampris incognitus]XP_056150346.1 adenine nucleotide translocase lysine N-methyltransferase [Lampris incognitus]
MEDAIEVLLEDQCSGLAPSHTRDHPILTASTGALLAGLYGVWSLFTMPGFRKVPRSLRVPYLPSSKAQTVNIMKLLEGRRGRLADLGSGDGRLVFAACSTGFQCTGFELNSMLVAYTRGKAWWMGVPSSQATFFKKDFWMTDLSAYHNVMVFLAPGVMEVLGDKLLKELPDEACVIACRFPFTNWPHQSSVGSGLDQTWAYNISTVRSSLANE